MTACLVRPVYRMASFSPALNSCYAALRLRCREARKAERRQLDRRFPGRDQLRNELLTEEIRKIEIRAARRDWQKVFIWESKRGRSR